MHKIAHNFLESLKAQLLKSASISGFITEETKLAGQKFSFKSHEFQERIIKIVEDNPGVTLVVRKSSQLGISEVFHRIILALVALKPGTSVLVAFPSASLAQETCKTRLTNIIQGSERLSSLISKDVDSASVKSFSNSSIIYAIGANKASNSSLISRPISMVFCDELDKMDPKIYGSFRSRMTHTLPENRLVFYISTPTVEDCFIDAEYKECSITHQPYTICNNCLHEFIPDYYTHVRVPGFDKSLKLLTKIAASQVRVDLSYLECPNCVQEITEPTLTWKVESNPQGVPLKIGVSLDPFVAPDFIKMPDLVSSSLIYNDISEFTNQGLGKTLDLKDSSVQLSHIHYSHSDNVVGQYIMGCDLGKICTVLVGCLRSDTSIHITEMHLVELQNLEEFFAEINGRIVFTASVVDSMPYSDLVMRLVTKYTRLYSAIYVDSIPPKPELFTLKMSDKYDNMVRQIAINKNSAMDMLANSLDDFITIEPTPYENTLTSHILDMRRVRRYDTEEVLYKWIKSPRGQDHAWHSLLYAFLASKLAAAGINRVTAIPCTIRKINPSTRALLKKRFAN